MRSHLVAAARQSPSTLCSHYFLLSLFCHPLIFSSFLQSHPVSTLLVLPFLCVTAPSSVKADRGEGGRARGGREHESRGGGPLIVGQIRSRLSVRPFITYLWLCAHLHRRAQIQKRCVCCCHNAATAITATAPTAAVTERKTNKKWNGTRVKEWICSGTHGWYMSKLMNIIIVDKLYFGLFCFRNLCSLRLAERKHGK